MEDLELLKAIMAVAAADGEFRRAEMGVVKGLAERIGVGQVSFEAMLDTAQQDKSFADNLLIQSKARARAGLELLVGLARIDGLICDEEREVIVRVATTLGITGDEFERIYLAGIARADELRRSRKAAPG